VINGLGYGNAMFWIVLIAAIVGFCGYHWRAYRLYIVQRHSLDGMVLASLRGSAFIAVLFCAGAAAQSLLILCAYLLQNQYTLSEFGARLGAVVAMVILTVIFCLIYWVLKVIRQSASASGTADTGLYKLQ
jgi:hypothetical protein